MTGKLDYSREEAMQILNDESYSDDDKRQKYDEYMDKLKKDRKNEIVTRLNEYAKNIPVITKEIYISKLKEYENDDLSKPFQIIESELLDFENEMNLKYKAYLEEQNKESIVIEPDVKPEEEDFEDTIFSDPIIPEVDVLEEDEEDEEVVPSLVINDSVLNEDPEILAKPLFDNKTEQKEVMPEDLPDDKEKGNASAIILSIIAIIIGAVVMYSIIRLN